MKIRTRLMPFVLGLAMSLGALAEEVTISMRAGFAGTIVTPITAGVLADGVTGWGPEPMIISDARLVGKGRFGKGLMKVVSRFDSNEPQPSTDCKGSGRAGLPLDMGYAFSVTTYDDFSQLYVRFTEGWICLNPFGASGDVFYWGYVSGDVVGGTGRFADASGTVSSDFYGHDLAGTFVASEDDHAGFGSFYGNMRAEIEVEQEE